MTDKDYNLISCFTTDKKLEIIWEEIKDIKKLTNKIAGQLENKKSKSSNLFRIVITQWDDEEGPKKSKIIQVATGECTTHLAHIKRFLETRYCNILNGKNSHYKSAFLDTVSWRLSASTEKDLKSAKTFSVYRVELAPDKKLYPELWDPPYYSIVFFPGQEPYVDGEEPYNIPEESHNE